MANVKITGLPAATALTADDLLAVVDDPAGTPTTKRATLQLLLDLITAADVSNTPSGNLAATDVQAALNELQTDVDTRLDGADSVRDLSDGASVAVQDGTLSVGDLVTVKSLAPLVVEGVASGTYVSVDDTTGLGIVWPQDPPGFTASWALAGINANVSRFVRVQGYGTITKLLIRVGTSAGNISLGIYRNTGAGRSAKPGTRVVTTGVIACPASGDAEVSLGGSYEVFDGDWFGISASDATMSTLRSATSSSALNQGFAAGEGGHPVPTTPLGTPASVAPYIVGVA